MWFGSDQFKQSSESTLLFYLSFKTSLSTIQRTGWDRRSGGINVLETVPMGTSSWLGSWIFPQVQLYVVLTVLLNSQTKTDWLFIHHLNPAYTCIYYLFILYCVIMRRKRTKNKEENNNIINDGKNIGHYNIFYL